MEKDSIFTIAACTAILFTNDLKHIHLHARGRHFDNIHSVTGEYYDKANNEADYLAEMALENKKMMPNPTSALTYLDGNWTPESDEDYTIETYLDALKLKLSLYTAALEILRNSNEVGTDVQSYLDDSLRYWNKELKYKLARRDEPLKINTSQFVQSSVDTDTAKYIAERLQREEGNTTWD